MPSNTAGLTPTVVARRALIASIIGLGGVTLLLVLWKVRVAIFLLFGAIVIASAMRPGVETLHRRGLPRAFGVAIHYLGVIAVVGVLLWVAVPRALSETQHAIAHLPQTRAEIHQEARQSHGLRRGLLVGLERRLGELPTARGLLDRAVELTRSAVEVVVGIFFLFASAAYWTFERERVEHVVLSLLPRPKRKKVSETWNLIDLKLGAFLRGQLILVFLVGTILSLAFWAIGLPYWLLVGVFAGIVELVPVLGPLAAGVLAIGVGLSESPQLALAAGLIVLGLRLLEDYLVIPRLLGNAVGLSPLIVLVTVSATGIVLGGFAVLLAIPIAALLVTIFDVLVLNKDPAKEDVPAVIFTANDN